MSQNGISEGAESLRWATAFCGALTLVAVVSWSLQRPIVTLPARPAATTRAAVELVAATEQAKMHDTIPLFLPSEHDAAVTLPRREGSGNILGYDASRLSFRETGLNL